MGDRAIGSHYPIIGYRVIAEANARTDVEVWEVTRANRDAFVERATTWLADRLIDYRVRPDNSSR